jgi:hypothetical protein
MNIYTIQAQLNIELASHFTSFTTFNPTSVTVTLDVEASSEENAIDQLHSIIENQAYLSLSNPHVTNLIPNSRLQPEPRSGYTSLTSLLNQVSQTSANYTPLTNSSYNRLT